MYLGVGLGVILARPKLDLRLMVHNHDHSRTQLTKFLVVLKGLYEVCFVQANLVETFV